MGVRIKAIIVLISVLAPLFLPNTLWPTVPGEVAAPVVTEPKKAKAAQESVSAVKEKEKVLPQEPKAAKEDAPAAVKTPSPAPSAGGVTRVCFLFSLYDCKH